MRKFFALLIVILYVALLGHFIYSNFVKVAGPSYLIKNAAYNNDDPGNINFCTSQNKDQNDLGPNDIESCVIHCPNLSFDDVAKPSPKIRGFPFETNSFVNLCENWEARNASDFNTARVLNWTYVGVLSLGTFMLLKKSRPKTN